MHRNTSALHYDLQARKKQFAILYNWISSALDPCCVRERLARTELQRRLDVVPGGTTKRKGAVEKEPALR